MYYNSVKYEEIGAIRDGRDGQDGAIYNGYVIRFGSFGKGWVSRLDTQEILCRFELDRNEEFMPHSNAVFFGTERYDERDEFPLLYTNLYNNYSSEEDRREGTLCVYRLLRNGNEFSTTLVQIIRIGFVEDRALWKSMEDDSDIRPYGNFVQDTDTNKLYAFVIRDKERITRYFEFQMPKLSDGVFSEEYGLPIVTLEKKDIEAVFDGAYAYYIQGACIYDSMLYSIEGGTIQHTENPTCPPRLQMMDLKKHKQIGDIPLWKFGFMVEPEFISYYDGKLYYADGLGALFVLNIMQE